MARIPAAELRRRDAERAESCVRCGHPIAGLPYRQAFGGRREHQDCNWGRDHEIARLRNLISDLQARLDQA